MWSGLQFGSWQGRFIVRRQSADTELSSKIWRHPNFRPIRRRQSTATPGGVGQPDRYRFRSGGIPNWRSVPSSVGGCKRMRSSFSK